MPLLVTNIFHQFQDSEQDDTESYCSDYGSGLATSPPGRLSDTDSTIEAISVSSDLPLKTFPISRLSSSLRKKPNLKTLRWRSCQELLKPHETKTMLKRQLSEQSLKCLEEEQILPGGSVEVYDGNLGVSRVTLSRYKHNQSSSSAYNHTSLTAPDEDINGHISEKLSSRYTEFSVKTIETDCSSKPRTNRVSAREKRIAHVESGESLDFGCHDSQRVEVSDSLCGERMEIDDCILPPLASSKQANLAPLEAYSNQHSLPGSKRQSPRAFKSNESSCNENEESVLGKQYGRDPSVPSTKKTYNGRTIGTYISYLSIGYMLYLIVKLLYFAEGNLSSYLMLFVTDVTFTGDNATLMLAVVMSDSFLC